VDVNVVIKIIVKIVVKVVNKFTASFRNRVRYNKPSDSRLSSNIGYIIEKS